MTAVSTRPIQQEQQQERPAKGTVPEEQHLFLSGVSWESYIAIGNALLDRPGLRITYDAGALEFMTLSRAHEFYKKWLDSFIFAMAEELLRPIAPGGSMTFQREDLKKGLEGDEVYWIEHEAQMRSKLTWDPDIDPPPDLALEIEVSRSVLNRLAIYAALKIREVWSYNGTSIRIRCLQPDGTYQPTEKSACFAEVPIQEIARFLQVGKESGLLTAIKEFRAWLRQILGKPAG